MPDALLLHSSFRYVYLIVFFALLSGFFHPFISGSSMILVVIGIITLFAGLAGGILLYRAATLERRRVIAEEQQPPDFPDIRSGEFLEAKTVEYWKTDYQDTRRAVFLAAGFVLIGVSLVYVYQLTGRI